MWSQSYFDVALVAAGQVDDPSLLADTLSRYHTLIAVDGGLQHLAAMDLVPAMLVGDLDSVELELLEQYSRLPVVDYPTDKDYSDLELALQLDVVQEAREVCIFGATGGRIDHCISNLRVLAQDPTRIALETESERIFVLPQEARFKLEPGTQVSLMPLFGPVKELTTEGLVWDLNQATLDQQLMSLSNRTKSPEITIKHSQGILICSLFKNCF